MTPRTRTANGDASYKVFYSVKIPQQVRFPHRRKTVRRTEPAEQDVGKERQMRFLPEKMRKQRDHVGEKLEEELIEVQPTNQGASTEEDGESTPVNRRRDRKRKDDGIHGASDSIREPPDTSSKRQRRTTVPRKEPSRTLQRQSTMTQLADGRRPSPRAEEPDLKVARRRSRVSSGNLGGIEREKDTRQRTLTQMIPSMGRLSKKELKELSGMDAELEDDDRVKDTVSQILIEQGLLRVDAHAHKAWSPGHAGKVKDNTVQVQQAKKSNLPAVLRPQTPDMVQAVEATLEDYDEEDYHPTQFIDAPSRRTRQTRRGPVQKTTNESIEPDAVTKARFGSLSTPEKRRVYEIPSSQSPAESVSSTQISPEGPRRSILRERSINTTVAAETPSNHRQSVFKEPTIQPAPPARLRKFESTIQDSEDEDDNDLLSDAAEQDLIKVEDEAVYGRFVGAETQAVLNRVDLPYSNDAGDLHFESRVSSAGTEGAFFRQSPCQPSPELGECWAPVIYDDDGPEIESYRSSRLGATSPSLQHNNDPKESLPVLEQSNMMSQMDLTTQAPMQTIPSTPSRIQLHRDLPSTPIVMRVKSSDDCEAEPESSAPRTMQRVIAGPHSALLHQATEIHGGLVQFSASQSMDCETQQSYSSKAEQQLHSEWLSYSQYVHARAPHSSSMHAAVDAFSCNATPRPPDTGAVSSPGLVQHSQATTVDEVTPKKTRKQQVISATTTPHRSSKSQCFISPEKPPSLYIPSSFPSPSRMEGWSSPVAARTQNLYANSQVIGSLDDFSIPLPPPMEDD